MRFALVTYVSGDRTLFNDLRSLTFTKNTCNIRYCKEGTSSIYIARILTRNILTISITNKEFVISNTKEV